jgi:hypothetical protein
LVQVKSLKRKSLSQYFRKSKAYFKYLYSIVPVIFPQDAHDQHTKSSKHSQKTSNNHSNNNNSDNLLSKFNNQIDQDLSTLKNLASRISFKSKLKDPDETTDPKTIMNSKQELRPISSSTTTTTSINEF